MIRISQLRLPCGSDTALLEPLIRKQLRLKQGEPMTFQISRHAIDTRKRPVLLDVYTVEVSLSGIAREKKAAASARSGDVQYMEEKIWRMPASPAGIPPHGKRPVVVGFGPAGIFCALLLARAGLRPIVLERGAAVEERSACVDEFWKTGVLDPDCNIQFGEGGAGTYSDGKLTTGIKDPSGRIREVLRTFAGAGAPEEILYESLPHIGTDCLREVVRNLRLEILRLGGEIRFRSRMTGLILHKGAVTGVEYASRDGQSHVLETGTVILAPGHSARDTMRRLHALRVPMAQKSFAVGFRVSHPQEIIDMRTYGTADPAAMGRLRLPHASYKLTASLPSGRSIYSFCMCPGGYVVNASSEAGRLAVNGMSDFARDSARANSAIVMPVGAGEFGSPDVLAGMEYQERLEARAFSLADGRIPVERYGDFRDAVTASSQAAAAASLLHAEGASPARPAGSPPRQGPGGRPADASADTPFRPLTEPEALELCVKGRAAEAPLHTLFPSGFNRDFVEGMQRFGRTIPGFSGSHAWVLGLESRTSSPVRILRGGDFQSEVRGLYPCGEGAGYAGGIMSAAVDGIKVAEEIIRSGQGAERL